MYKKKIICLILMVSLVFGSVVPRRTYAFEPVTATVTTLALALMAAAGVTFVVGAERIENVVNNFLETNPHHKNFLQDLLKTIPDNPGTHGLVISATIFKMYKSKILDFIGDVIKYFRKPDTITVNNPGFSYLAQNVYDEKFLLEQVQDFRNGNQSDFVGDKFSPFAVQIYCNDSSSQVRFTFHYPYKLGNVYKIYRKHIYYDWKKNITGTKYLKFSNVSDSDAFNGSDAFSGDIINPYVILKYGDGGFSSAKGYFKFYSGSGIVNKSVFDGWLMRDELLLLDGISIKLYRDSFLPDTSNGKNMLTALNMLNDALQYVPSDLPFVDAVPPISDIVYPDGVTSDVVVDKWTDALNGKNDIVISPVAPDTLVGQHGYDVAYGDGERPGVITGVDVPVLPVDKPIVPDLPVPPDVVNPDLTGISGLLSGIKSILQNIFDFVKSLPATIIGDGTIDFSKFENIKFSTVFPFCIPFDLKNAIVSFNVLPREPIWEIDFAGTFMSSAGSFVIDLRRFEKLFGIVRFFAYGGFVTSLIILTRKIVK